MMTREAGGASCWKTGKARKSVKWCRAKIGVFTLPSAPGLAVLPEDSQDAGGCGLKLERQQTAPSSFREMLDEAPTCCRRPPVSCGADHGAGSLAPLFWPSPRDRRGGLDTSKVRRLAKHTRTPQPAVRQSRRRSRALKQRRILLSAGPNTHSMPTERRWGTDSCSERRGRSGEDEGDPAPSESQHREHRRSPAQPQGTDQQQHHQHTTQRGLAGGSRTGVSGQAPAQRLSTHHPPPSASLSRALALPLYVWLSSPPGRHPWSAPSFVSKGGMHATP